MAALTPSLFPALAALSLFTKEAAQQFGTLVLHYAENQLWLMIERQCRKIGNAAECPRLGIARTYYNGGQT